MTAPETAVGIGSSKPAGVRMETRATRYATDRDSPDLLSKRRESRNPFAELRELLAAIEHKQWWSWTLAVKDEVSPKTLERWKKNWKPYEELDELEKAKDRVWANVILMIPLLQEWREKAETLDHINEWIVRNYPDALLKSTDQVRALIEKAEKWDTMNFADRKIRDEALLANQKLLLRLEAVKKLINELDEALETSPSDRLLLQLMKWSDKIHAAISVKHKTEPPPDALLDHEAECRRMKRRLEAVKKILKEPINDTGSGDPGDMAEVINKLYEKLDKIHAAVEGAAEEEK